MLVRPRAAQATLQPLEVTTRTKFVSVLKYQGPVLVYPINRVAETPLDVYTMVDVMRNTLGVGPCQHILDSKGRSGVQGRGDLQRPATPHCPSTKRASRKSSAWDVEKNLEDGLIFVKHIRGRITHYVEFGHKMRQYLAEQKKAHAELGKFKSPRWSNSSRRWTHASPSGRTACKTPGQGRPDERRLPQGRPGLRRRPTHWSGARRTRPRWCEIGGNQDELVGECRWVVRRSCAASWAMMALDPRVAPIASEIRTRTQEALRNPANHEGRGSENQHPRDRWFPCELPHVQNDRVGLGVCRRHGCRLHQTALRGSPGEVKALPRRSKAGARCADPGRHVHDGRHRRPRR